MKWASVFLVTVLVSGVLGKNALRISPTNIRADKKEEVKKKVPVDAYLAFKMIAEVPKSNDGKSEEKVIFSGGKFCSGDPSTKPTSSCLQPDIHDDRTLFFYQWALGHNDSNIMKPTVSVSNSTIMDAQILDDFDMTKTAGHGRFTVQYGCKIKGEGTITMKMQVTKKKAVTISWKKICGSGVNEFVSLISSDGSYVGPTQQTTDIELHTKMPQAYIDFKAPYLTMSDSGVGAKLRGHLQAGMVSFIPKQFTVIYTCKERVESTMVLTVAIPPWNNVTLKWKKNCGGTPPPGFLIMQDKVTVFNHTHVSPKFNVDEYTDVRTASKRSIFELDPEESKLDFSIENTGDEDLQLGAVVSTVSNPDVLAVRPEASDSFFGEDRLSDAGKYSMDAKTVAKLSLRCICLARGKAVVLMSIPVLGYESVEFGFYKECKRPHVFHHSGFLRTAGSLMFFFVLLAIGGGIMLYRRYRNRETSTTTKYTRVRVSG